MFKLRGLRVGHPYNIDPEEDRILHQDPEEDRFIPSSELARDNAGDDLEMIAVFKRSVSLLPQKEIVRIDLQPFEQETEPLAKICCGRWKMMQTKLGNLAVILG